MKKISILILFLFCAIISFAQFPNNQSASDTNTLFHYKGGLTAKYSILPIVDTLNNKAVHNVGALTVRPQDTTLTYPPFYESNGHFWFNAGSALRSHDTLYAELPLFFDSTTRSPSTIIKFLRGNGIVSGGTVSVDSCRTLDVIPTIVSINYVQYSSPATILTIPASDPTFARIDEVIDSLGIIILRTGTPSITPIGAPINAATEILLASYTFAANASCVINQIIIWDENVGTPTEFALTTSGTISVNGNNTDKPFHLLKGIFVNTYTNGSQLIFTASSPTTAQLNEILKFYVYLNGTFGSNQFVIQFFNGSTTVGTPLAFGTGFGFNPNDSDQYQIVVPPLSSFGISSQTFNKIVITFSGNDLSGAKGLYLDWIQLQTGATNIPLGLNLTTNFSSGASTYNSQTNTLNVPIYSGGSGGGDSIVSILKNAARDSVITTMFDGRRFAIKDSVGASGGTVDTSLLLHKVDSINNITGYTTKYQNSLKADKATTLTINGTGYDLSTNRSWTVSGSVVSDSVKERQIFYHNEFWWNHGLDSSTGAVTSQKDRDICDYLPIPGSKSITMFAQDGSNITVYGWTYDSSLTPISEIRSNTLIGVKLSTYTFTTPSNARYINFFTKAAGDSFQNRLNVVSTDSITYATPITPEQYSGTETQKIQQAVNFARWTSSGVTLTGLYGLDSAIILSSGSRIIMNNATVIRNYGDHDNNFRNEAVANPSQIFDRGNKYISIVGLGKALIKGSTENWGTSYPCCVNGQYWRSNAILMANVDIWDITGISFQELNASGIIPEQSRNGQMNNLKFIGGGVNLNEGGIIVGRGNYNLNMSNIYGSIEDDLISLENIPSYLADSINILGTVKNYIPYHINDTLAIMGINVKDIQTAYNKSLSGCRVRVCASWPGIVHDINIDGVMGYNDIEIGLATSAYGPNYANLVYNMNVSNTGQAAIYIKSSVKNSTFFNVSKYDTTHTIRCVLPDSTLNVYRKYYSDLGTQVDSVYSGITYINYGRSDSAAWSLPGNPGVSGTSKLGSTNTIGLNVVTNNVSRIRIDSAGAESAVQASNIAVNGNFDADANWTKGTGWTISGGTANKSTGTQSDLSQDMSEVNGTVYRVKFQYTRSAGILSFAIGGTTYFTTYSSASGSVDIYVTATNTGDCTFTGNSTFVGTLDSVQVYPLTPIPSWVKFENGSGVERLSLRSSLNNIFLGLGAGENNMTGLSNVAFGWQALYSNISGVGNAAFGTSALFSNISGTNNTAIGGSALLSNITGYNNIAIGISTLQNNQSGLDNIAEGFWALKSNLTGQGNNAFGNSALTANTTGSNNTASGYSSLAANISGLGNNAYGYSSLVADVSGNYNNAFGYRSLAAATSAGNTAMGTNSLSTVNSNGYNTGVGYSAGTSSTGTNSSFFGTYAGQYMTTEGNLFVLNSLDRTDKTGDSTKSLLYAVQNTTVANQYMKLGGGGKVGINYYPNSNFSDSGSISLGYAATATSIGLGISNNVMEVTATGQTITLPTAISITGRLYTIKLTSSGSCTVGTTSSQTIDGSATYSLSAQYKYVEVMSNGANWIIIANN